MTDEFENLSVAELRRRGTPPKQILAEMKRRGMSNQEIIETWSPRPPISGRVGSRSLRRRVVIAMYACWLLGVVSMELSVQAGTRWMTVGLEALAIGALVIATAAIVRLSRRTYINAPRIADRELDERLVQVKNQAYRTAFQIFGFLVVCAWPLSLLLASVEPGVRGTTGALLLFGGVSLVVTTLPTAIVAWREPDPEP
jgi:uncharacterized membrane protein